MAAEAPRPGIRGTPRLGGDARTRQHRADARTLGRATRRAPPRRPAAELCVSDGFADHRPGQELIKPSERVRAAATGHTFRRQRCLAIATRLEIDALLMPRRFA